MTLDTRPDVEEEDDIFAIGPTIYSHIHVLANDPVVTFDGETYPSIDLQPARDLGITYTDVRFTVTGTRAQRVAFSAQLRAVADAIEVWQPKPTESEADAELAARDDRIDAGLGTGYIGEFS